MGLGQGGGDGDRDGDDLRQIKCGPREEIRAGELSLDLFAAKLRLVVEQRAPAVYQDAGLFFANTFATDGLKTLIKEVFGRLVGNTVGAPVIRLETSFGGGKNVTKKSLKSYINVDSTFI